MDTIKQAFWAVVFYCVCGIAVVEILGYCVFMLYAIWCDMHEGNENFDD